MRVKHIYLLLLTCIIAFNRCSCSNATASADIAGNGLETPNAIAGLALIPNTTEPAINASVFLFKKQLDATPSILIDSTTTNEVGEYEFSNVAIGEYSIKIESADNTWVQRATVEVTQGVDPVVGPTSSEKLYSLKGAVSFEYDTLSLRAVLNDSLYSVDVQADSTFTLTGVSADSYVLSIEAFLPGGEGSYPLFVDTLVVDSTTTDQVIAERYTVTDDYSIKYDTFEDSTNATVLGGDWYIIDESEAAITRIDFYNIVVDPIGAADTDKSGILSLHFTEGSDQVVILGAPLGSATHGYAADISSLKQISFSNKANGGFNGRVCIVSQLYSGARICSAPFDDDNKNDIWRGYDKVDFTIENDPSGTLTQEQIMRWATDLQFVIEPSNTFDPFDWWVDEVRFYY